MRAVTFTPDAWDEYTSWETDAKTLRKLNRLIQLTSRTPEEGIGNPEALKNELSGYWSRHITQKDRLVYKATETELIIIQCKGHYSDK